MTVVGSAFIEILPLSGQFSEELKKQVQLASDQAVAENPQMFSGLSKGASQAEAQVTSSLGVMSSKTEESAGRMEKALDDTGAKTKETGSLFDSLSNKIGTGMQSAAGALASAGVPMAGTLGTVGEKFKAASASGNGFSSVMTAVGGVTVATAVVVAAASVEMAMKFQDSTAALAGTADISIGKAKEIGKAFLGTAGSTEFSAQQMVDAYAPVSMQLATVAGHALDSGEALKIMKTASDLAEASGISLGSATSDLGKVMQSYGMNLNQANTAADTLYNLSRITAQPIDTLVGSVDRLHARLGDVAPNMSDVAGLMAVLAEHGAAGARSATMVSASLSTLLGNTAPVTAELHTLGVNVYDANGQFVGMQSVVSQLSPIISNMSDQQRKAADATLFGKNQAQLMTSVLLSGAPAYASTVAAIGQVGSAHDAAVKQEQTFAGTIRLVKAALLDYAVIIGQAVMPILAALGRGVADVLNFMAHFRDIGLILAALIGGPLVLAVGMFTAHLIAMGIAAGVDAVMGLVGAFTAMIGTVSDLVLGMTALDMTLPEAIAGVGGLDVALGGLALASGGILLVLGAIALGVVGVIHVLDEGSASAKKASGAWVQLFMEDIPQGADKAAAASVEIDNLGTKIAANNAILNQAGNGTVYWRQSLQTLANQGNSFAQSMISQGIPANDKYANGLESLRQKTLTLKDEQGGLQSQIKAMATNAQTAATATGAAATATQSLNSQLSPAQTYANNLATAQTNVYFAALNLTTAENNANTALQGLNDTTLGMMQSNDSWLGQLNNLSSALATSHGSLNLQTTDGLAAKSALDQLSGSTFTQVQALVKQGASTQTIDALLLTHQASIETVGAKYGLTKVQIDKYLTSIDQTPSQVNTLLALNGYTAAKSNLDTYKNDLTNLPKVTTVTVNADGTWALPKGTPTSYSPSAARLNSYGAAAGAMLGPGFVTAGPVLVGEGRPAYPEYVIPTDPAHRGNALALTGSLLKNLTGMASGGIRGGVMAGHPLVGHPYTGNVAADIALNTVYKALGTWTAAPLVAADLAALASAMAAEVKALTASTAAAGGGGGGVASTGSNFANMMLGMQLAAKFGWGSGAEWTALNSVAMRESGWSSTAQNPTSSAFGIAQNIGGAAGYGAYGTSPAGQIDWMLAYIQSRYGDPIGAWNHELRYGWYDQGGALPPGLSLAMNTTGRAEVVRPGGGGTVTIGDVNITVEVMGSSNMGSGEMQTAIKAGVTDALEDLLTYMGGPPQGGPRL